MMLLPEFDPSTLPAEQIPAALAALAEKSGSAGSAGSPSIVVSRTYPAIRTYGADAAVPTRWFTIKGEAAYFTSSSPDTDEYVLYVLQIERQTGEWVLVGGYAGEAVTAHRAALSFAATGSLAKNREPRVVGVPAQSAISCLTT